MRHQQENGNGAIPKHLEDDSKKGLFINDGEDDIGENPSPSVKVEKQSQSDRVHNGLELGANEGIVSYTISGFCLIWLRDTPANAATYRDRFLSQAPTPIPLSKLRFCDIPCHLTDLIPMHMRNGGKVGSQTSICPAGSSSPESNSPTELISLSSSSSSPASSAASLVAYFETYSETHCQ